MAVYVTGIRETQAALKGVDNKLERRLLREDLKDAVQPVADAGREKIGRYRGARVGRIRPIVQSRAVKVRQSESKRTGKRGDFGSLQWRLLAEALDENEDGVRDELQKALDRIIEREGL